MHIYRFLNQHNNIIYIGRTNNVMRRLRQEHFTPRGHLPDTCYKETVAVDVATLSSPNEAKMYELYLIEQHHPKYNQSDIGGGQFSFTLDEPKWERFVFNTDKPAKSKQELISLITSFQDEIKAECTHAENMLRNQDTHAWLDKLSDDERNEYLRVVYTLERFVQNIASRNNVVKQQIQ